MPPPEPTGRYHLFKNLARVCREMVDASSPAHAVWSLLEALRSTADVDRAGVFMLDPARNSLDLITGVDAEGRPEFATSSFPINDARTPMMEVARRERPYYFSNAVRQEYPHCGWTPGMTAHAIVPIIAGDQLLGTLHVDNALRGQPMAPELLELLFLVAGLAALPMLALYQQKQRERTDRMRREVLREMLHAVTGGKIRLRDRREMADQWPTLEEALVIDCVEAVPGWRQIVRTAGQDAGLPTARIHDLELCAAEAASNALFHGNGGRAAVEARNGQVRVRLTDRGAGIAPEDLAGVTLVPGRSTKQSAGLGYTLITDLSDGLYLCTDRQGTDLIIEMCVEPLLNLPEGWADLI